ncbi:hypothetical protein [Mesobacillus harenae]|nr:hypothetical protein [Mesobacillus harenae]
MATIKYLKQALPVNENVHLFLVHHTKTKVQATRTFPAKVLWRVRMNG